MTHKISPRKIPDLEEPCPLFILTKATKTPRGPTTDVSKSPPGFMLHMDFAFLNVESIRGITSTFVAIYSVTSQPFGFPPRSKRPPLYILKFLVTTLRNQDNKFWLIGVDKYGSLARLFMKTCHNMNIPVKTIGGDGTPLNGKIEILNKTLANITRAILI